MGTLDLIPPGKGIGDLGPFLSTFSSARPLLVSDYDGTLAPFRRERGEALPGEHIRSLLMEIAAEGGEIVVLSGRRAEEVALLLDLPLASKRTAMESILNGRSPRDPVCYLGDDLTDEDAFEALRGRGLGVLVADEPRPSAAQMWIAPSSVTIFLALWRDELKGKEESVK